MGRLVEVSGYAYPGQVLALMGPSGSGKSTLLDALAGRLDMNTKQSGQILAYVTQDDALVTTLTLKESVYYSSELQLPASMSKSEKRKRADDCIKEMGLQESINTTIGGGLGIKGLSGGERRRLSICIEILTHPKLLFLDEPTSGLDSAASFYVMSRILDNERRNGRTIIASIHQPSSQVFRLFDNLCLLSAGKIVYFGPVTETNEVFKRERLNGHYGTNAFVVANTLSSMPYLLLVSLIPGAITYYLPGLKRDCQSFIYFALALFSCMLLVESLMMILASLVPNFLMGIVTGAGVQGLMILGAGFFRLPNDLPKLFWKYPLYYISFNKYAYQGLFKNEFEGLEILKIEGKSSYMIPGSVILKDMWQMETRYSKWVDLAILLGMVLSYRLLFLIIIKVSEKLKIVIKAFVMRPPKQVMQVDSSC
ncbi:ABC transporter G family member 11 [Bienertia sinuspersici]